MAKIQLGHRVEKSHIKKVKAAAKKQKVSESQIIRNLIDKYL